MDSSAGREERPSRRSWPALTAQRQAPGPPWSQYSRSLSAPRAYSFNCKTRSTPFGRCAASLDAAEVLYQGPLALVCDGTGHRLPPAGFVGGQRGSGCVGQVYERTDSSAGDRLANPQLSGFSWVDWSFVRHDVQSVA